MTVVVDLSASPVAAVPGHHQPRRRLGIRVVRAPGCDDHAARGGLPHPREQAGPHPARGDHPVVGRARRMAEQTVPRDHPHPAVSGPPQCLPCRLGHDRVHLHRHHVSGAGPVRQECGVPPGARADLQHPPAGPYIEVREHRGHHARHGRRGGEDGARRRSGVRSVVPLRDDRHVGVRVPVPGLRVHRPVDGDRSAARGVVRPHQAGQEGGTGHRGERRGPVGRHEPRLGKGAARLRPPTVSVGHLRCFPSPYPPLRCAPRTPSRGFVSVMPCFRAGAGKAVAQRRGQAGAAFGSGGVRAWRGCGRGGRGSRRGGRRPRRSAR